jgi:DNA-binding MarR family transcriptional regulator
LVKIVRTSHKTYNLPDTARQVIHYLNVVGEYGCTWKELADKMGTHHGTASGALSNLHKSKEIARLTDKRGGSSIYVLPNYINGRKYVAYRSSAAKRALLELADQIEQDLNRGDIDACYRHLQEARDKFSD